MLAAAATAASPGAGVCDPTAAVIAEPEAETGQRQRAARIEPQQLGQGHAGSQGKHHAGLGNRR